MGTSFFGHVSRFFTLAATVALAACSTSSETQSSTEIIDTGSGPIPLPPSGGPNSPKGFFLTAVAPGLQQNCGGCHAHADSGAPVFMGESSEATYVLLTFTSGMIAAPVNSLLTHQGPHAGPALSAELGQTIDTWLLQEKTAHGIPNPGLPTLETGIASIGHCMSIDDFMTYGLDALASLDTNGKGKCVDCHANGTGGAFLSGDAKETLAKSGSVPFITRWVRAKIGDGGASVDFEPSKAWVTTGSGSCDPSKYACHPTYTIPTTLLQGMDAFVSGTLDRWHSTKCGVL